MNRKTTGLLHWPRLSDQDQTWGNFCDIFTSFCRHLGTKIKYEFVKLAFFSRQSRIFGWQNLPEYEALTDEIIRHRLMFMDSGSYSIEEIRKNCRHPDRLSYCYNHTNIHTWKINDEFYGVLFSGSNRDDKIKGKSNEWLAEFLDEFGIQVHKFYIDHQENEDQLREIIGRSSAVVKLKSLIMKTGKVDYPLLITGESGCGKELVAKAVHRISSGTSLRLYRVNAAAIPDHLIEAELFGYKKGSFTGALEDKTGMIEKAHRGTLFLDEIAELPPSLQVKLLRVLQEKEIQRIGETKARRVDFRLITATNRDLEGMMKEGKFRDDLFYRIQDLRIQVPPLRERKEDIPLLVEYFFKKYGFKRIQDTELQHISGRLKYKNWPGNVRELESCIKRLITFYPELWEEDGMVREPEKGLIKQREEFEKNLLVETLRKTGWNKTRTARELNLSRNYLLQLIKKYHLTRS